MIIFDKTNEHADGVALANVLQYEKFNIKSLKEELIKKDINARKEMILYDYHSWIMDMVIFIQYYLLF